MELINYGLLELLNLRNLNDKSEYKVSIIRGFSKHSKTQTVGITGGGGRI